MTVNIADGDLVEVHLATAKHGTFGAGMTDAVAHLLTTALRHGMPVEEFVRTFLNTRFEPSGLSDDPDIGRVSSPMDYLARRIALDTLPTERLVSLGIAEPATAA
ncbi:vitamin B12-dependent ribonucleotide reductase [Saccharopolyspora indica]|uniref:TSCPD domain-containing protein n=1 Tax=Saccharopolyspora indica TaxID=1229659 RepID=UPI0022EA4D12|nr:vitamin B12-dependent ribonucleotide reductase [Saccharopolyspora indica]MDA3644335.1 vitamin B12-dependent ribonucleotide reductase [Saccharopolyspora indica]